MNITDGQAVRTNEGITGVVVGEPALTPTGLVATVRYDAEFSHLSPVGGADYRVRELTAIDAS